MTRDEAALERLRREYNVALANGLVLKARMIGRVLDAIERRSAVSGKSLGSPRD